MAPSQELERPANPERFSVKRDACPLRPIRVSKWMCLQLLLIAEQLQLATLLKAECVLP